MDKCICLTCAKRNNCRFGKELIIALENLTTMVSRDVRAQIEAIVAKDIGCGDYQKEAK